MNILEIIVLALTVLLAVTGYRMGFVRKLASLFSLVLSIVLVSACLPYVTEFLKTSTPVYDFIVKECREVVQQGTDGFFIDMADSQTQAELIRNLPLPEVFREQLLKNNNQEGYRSLGVTTFQDYVVHFSATVILNAVSFVAALLLIQILFRVVIAAMDILSHIPVLGGINRLAGLLLGLLQALLLLWVFFMFLSAASTTETGLRLLSMVQESAVLSYLYDSNFFMRIVLQTAAVFL